MKHCCKLPVAYAYGGVSFKPEKILIDKYIIILNLINLKSPHKISPNKVHKIAEPSPQLLPYKKH